VLVEYWSVSCEADGGLVCDLDADGLVMLSTSVASY
jgi:hypothetical protein